MLLSRSVCIGPSSANPVHRVPASNFGTVRGGAGQIGTAFQETHCDPPPGQRGGQLPSSVWTRHTAVKQGQPCGSDGTTYQGKGRVSREIRIGQAGRARSMGAAAACGKGSKERARVSGERPIGAASCRQQYNQASCQPSTAPLYKPAASMHSPALYCTPAMPPPPKGFAWLTLFGGGVEIRSPLPLWGWVICVGFGSAP